VRGSANRFRLDGWRSFELGGRIAASRWTLGRRQLSRRSGFKHTFPSRAGHAYHVRLTVTDALGRTASMMVVVRPAGLAPDDGDHPWAMRS
jgi:hypothetical protein